ncbi:redoxin family protein [Sphingomonas sp. RS2018]
MRRWLIWVPLAAFAVVLWVAASQLNAPADRSVKSALVGKPLPAFTLPPMVPGKPGLDARDFRDGQPRLLNVFASWCVPCAIEAPQLDALRRGGARIDAVAIRDKGGDVQRFLSRHGDPYQRIGNDPASAVQLALGSAGVPETFVIDGRGIIVAQHIGDIRADDVPVILAELEKAR